MISASKLFIALIITQMIEYVNMKDRVVDILTWALRYHLIGISNYR